MITRLLSPSVSASSFTAWTDSGRAEEDAGHDSPDSKGDGVSCREEVCSQGPRHKKLHVSSDKINCHDHREYCTHIIIFTASNVRCIYVCRMDGYNMIRVSDFGLSEDMYAKNYFRQDKDASVKLPVKWMAPESLNDGIFTEKSDVVCINICIYM